MERTVALPTSAPCAAETTNALISATTQAATFVKLPRGFIKFAPGCFSLATRMDASVGAGIRLSNGIIARGESCHSGPAPAELQLKNWRGSVILPAIALAATVIGEAR